VNESVPDKHVASITELDDVCMNLKTHFVVYVDFAVLGAGVEQEGEGVLVRVEKTASHCGVERNRERGRRVGFGVTADEGVEGEDGGDWD